MNQRMTAVVYAILAAAFYAANMPVSKLLLTQMEPTFLAAFLYLGAGTGVGLMLLLNRNPEHTEKLTGTDLPYTIGMIVLDIAAPILLMIGIQSGSSSNASLLGNFEIVATTLIALYVFHETVSRRLWTAIALITLSSAILAFEDAGSLHFSIGSLFVLGAASCWGLENNCTRKISSKNTYEIVTLKGIFSGSGSFLIALLTGEHLPAIPVIICAYILGFFSYGLSIFLYIRAQRTIGAAKTSAYYAIAPFIGVFLSFVFLHEALTWRFMLALCVMAAGTFFTVLDTLVQSHTHLHTHILVHVHDGVSHSHTVVHSHPHNHYVWKDRHNHYHSSKELEQELLSMH